MIEDAAIRDRFIWWGIVATFVIIMALAGYGAWELLT